MKTALQFLFIALAFVFFLPIDAEAQAVGKRDYYHQFTRDTLTNADTTVFSLPYDFADPFVLFWQAEVANISGTTGGTLTLETSNCPSTDSDCDIWDTSQSWTIDENSLDTVITYNVLPGIRLRGTYISAGTQSTDIQNVVFFYRKEKEH